MSDGGRRHGRITAAAQLGITAAAVAASITAGHALLLYTGGGFLRAAGFIIALTLGSMAAGLWAGVGARGFAATRARWVIAVATLIIAGFFATAWLSSIPLRDSGYGRALAVLLLLAMPAYTAGSLFMGLAEAGPGGATAALAGAAIGVLAAAALLIPRYNAPALYLGAAAAVVLARALRPWGALPGNGRNDMNGRVALITGVGARGQAGFAIAERFLRAGAHVIVTGRGAPVEDIARELSAHGDAVAVMADLLAGDDVDRLLAVVQQRFGRLDVLVNVAGGLSLIKPLADTSPEEWRREIERNAETALRVSNAALPMLRAAHGAIVNFAAPAGLRAVKSLGAYSAAKAAVVALTRAMALEEKSHGVRVNALAPGLIDTGQNRQNASDPDDAKFVTREQIADAVLFLASDAAAGISGETVHVLGEGLR